CLERFLLVGVFDQCCGHLAFNPCRLAATRWIIGEAGTAVRVSIQAELIYYGHFDFPYVCLNFDCLLLYVDYRAAVTLACSRGLSDADAGLLKESIRGGRVNLRSLDFRSSIIIALNLAPIEDERAVWIVGED